MLFLLLNNQMAIHGVEQQHQRKLEADFFLLSSPPSPFHSSLNEILKSSIDGKQLIENNVSKDYLSFNILFQNFCEYIQQITDFIG